MHFLSLPLKAASGKPPPLTLQPRTNRTQIKRHVHSCMVSVSFFSASSLSSRNLSISSGFHKCKSNLPSSSFPIVANSTARKISPLDTNPYSPGPQEPRNDVKERGRMKKKNERGGTGGGGRGREGGRTEIPFSLLRVVLSMVLLRTLTARVQACSKVMPST
jgi:hypothetical protein